ncbi:MAG: hypothetical protein F6K23_35115 [Okeania sp. SIO2C9]|uniref:hypothetical protein n=1 Tax=Okeania sp. SIO2C9 TaxID=2607791 RepID=UPI0013C1FBB2|nr:hypothetical protein [Okeania sp. SIO2C9]NEQ77789.1 hypothetical protein [Okeania sp. SIO2C9]
MTNQTNIGPNYDANITPTDVADRMEREGENFMKTPETEAEENNTTSGYTVDTEGRLNNFAIEPEMYVNEPGDLRQQEEEQRLERAKTMKEINQTNEDGNLSMSEDNRGKGTGII